MFVFRTCWEPRKLLVWTGGALPKAAAMRIYSNAGAPSTPAESTRSGTVLSPSPKPSSVGRGGGHKPHQRNAPAGKLRHGDVRPDREPLAGRAFPFAPRFLLRTPRCRRRFNYTELNATQDGAGWGGGTCSRIPFQKLTEQKKKKKEKKWFYPTETNNSSGLLQCKVELQPSPLGARPRLLPAPGHRARACASAALARSSLLVFTGTLARFRFSCLVFLANSSRVKLFNNIFGGTQAAGEAEPKRFSSPPLWIRHFGPA